VTSNINKELKASSPHLRKAAQNISKQKKTAHKMLMKETPVVNFINILCEHFFVQKFVLSQTLSIKNLLKKLLYKR